MSIEDIYNEDEENEQGEEKNPLLSEHLEEELQKELEAEGITEDSSEAEEPQENTEQEAKKFGHLSKEDWIAQGRDPAKYKSPEEFVKYGNDYKEVKDLIKSLKEENKTYTKQIDILVDAHKRSAESSVAQAKLELENQLKIAKEYGDVAAVERLTEQKIVNNIQAEQLQQQQLNDEKKKVDEIFVSRNKHWFNDSHLDLVEESKNISKEISSYYPNLSYAEHVRRIEERMKFEHPDLVAVKETTSEPHIGATASGMAKSTANSSAGNNEERAFKALSPAQRAEFNTVRKLVERIPGVKYTVSEYNEQNKRGPRNG